MNNVLLGCSQTCGLLLLSAGDLQEQDIDVPILYGDWYGSGQSNFILTGMSLILLRMEV